MNLEDWYIVDLEGEPSVYLVDCVGLDWPAEGDVEWLKVARGACKFANVGKSSSGVNPLVEWLTGFVAGKVGCEGSSGK